jgi:hypothetical protein
VGVRVGTPLPLMLGRRVPESVDEGVNVAVWVPLRLGKELPERVTLGVRVGVCVVVDVVVGDEVELVEDLEEVVSAEVECIISWEKNKMKMKTFGVRYMAG